MWSLLLILGLARALDGALEGVYRSTSNWVLLDHFETLVLFVCVAMRLQHFPRVDRGDERSDDPPKPIYVTGAPHDFVANDVVILECITDDRAADPTAGYIVFCCVGKVYA
jgi:hypothetical protein